MANKKYYFQWVVCGFMLCFMFSCKKYLAKSPDKQLTTPEVAQDLRAILDYNDLMNRDYPVYGAIASDDYYMTDNVYEALSPNACQGYYIWGFNGEPTDWTQDWFLNYKRIFYTNVVLDNVNKVASNGSSQQELDAIMGEALFYRSFTHFLQSQIYTLPYNPANASSTPGVPLRTTSDFNVESTRPNLRQEFNSIVKDLRTAASLLPDNSSGKLRPSRAAAFATLANVYLVMQNYEEAEKMADAALAIDDSLMDYNDIQADQKAPVPLLNAEVIWQADLGYNQILATSRSKVAKVFYDSYQANDLRKYVFFDTSGDQVKFKGHYNGQHAGTSRYFAGLAVDELYLIKAESAARMGNIEVASSTLNLLARNRFEESEFVPFDFADQNSAIEAILDMRRKELCFRGLYRWMDIRRLSQIPGEAVTLHRMLLGQLYTLKPGDLHYAFLIPQEVIDNSKIEQNRR